MAASFPSSVVTITAKTDNVSEAVAADINTPADEIEAIAAHLGSGGTLARDGGYRLTLVGVGGSTTVGYAGVVAANDVAGTAVTIIPNGTGDVSAILSGFGAVKASDDSVDGGIILVANNSSIELFNDGTDVLTLTVNSNGSAELQRTSGSTLTFDVVIKYVLI